MVGKLNLTTGKAVPKDSARVIQLQVESTLNISQLAGSNHALSESEGYVLEVLAARQRVVVSGLSTAGVFYGLQSLLSLLADNRTLPEVLRQARSSCFDRRGATCPKFLARFLQIL